MQRLPRLEVRRQQRHHGPAPDAGHELRQLHRPLLLGRRRRSAACMPWRSTEREEPQAVIGSSLHALAYPDDYRRARQDTAASSGTPTSIRARTSATASCTPSARTRSSACRPAANICMPPAARAGFACSTSPLSTTRAFRERITTAPVSPLGQRFYVATKYATAVASPATIAPDPTRSHRPENHEQTVAGVYGYLYVADKYEGLILVGAGTLLDGNPLEQLPQARRDVQSRQSALRGAESHDRGQLCLCLLRRGAGGGFAGGSEESAG